jgi:GGDEF domain-containing protein
MMISLTRSLSELDRLESLRKASLECYRSAVESTGRYVVETDENVTLQYRGQLEAILRRVKAAQAPDELRETRVSLQGELQEYAGKATRYVRTLQDKVMSAARALAEIVESVKRGHGDGERRLQTGIEQLSSIARSPQVAKLCPRLEAAVAAVEDGASQLRKQNQLVIAQLRDEVHSLQEALESAKEAAGRDPVSGVLNRAETLSRIRRELEANRAFNLVFVWISNYDYLHHRYGGHCLDELVAGFCERLREVAGPETPVGRWADDQFVALIERPKPEAMWIAESFGEQLAGPYVLRGQDWKRETSLRLMTGVVESPSGNTEAKLMLGADKLLIGLETIASPAP